LGIPDTRGVIFGGGMNQRPNSPFAERDAFVAQLC
jgi:hypothetical protein